MNLDAVSENGEVDSPISSKSKSAREAEHNLFVEKQRKNLIKSELDLSKMITNHEIDKLKRECSHLKDYVLRLEEDRDMFRSREAEDLERTKEFLEKFESNGKIDLGIENIVKECMHLKAKVSRLEENCTIHRLREAKDQERVKEFLESMEKNEKDFAEKLVELKMKNWDLELALHASMSRCDVLLEENRRLKKRMAECDRNEAYNDEGLILKDQVKKQKHENLTKESLNASLDSNACITQIKSEKAGANDKPLILEDAPMLDTPTSNKTEVDNGQSDVDCHWNSIIVTVPSEGSVNPQSQSLDLIANEESSSQHNIGLDHSSSFTTDEVFPSRSSLVDWVKKTGTNLGFVITIMKSQNHNAKRKGRITFGCDRSGIYRKHVKVDSSEKAKRTRMGSKKCNCPFSLKGVPLEGDSWQLKVKNGTHNHELPKTLVGHSHVSRLNEEEKSLVVDMLLDGAKPQEILATIKKLNANNLSTIKTIYNAKANLLSSLRVIFFRDPKCWLCAYPNAFVIQEDAHFQNTCHE